MNEALASMLGRYDCQSINDYENALKEIIQEISLLGLWRAKFFEKAAFYGGTALRIFYGLNRFSEELDFSLLSSNKSFQLKKYLEAIALELESYDLNIEIQMKRKAKESAIESAFIKAGTLQNFITIEIPKEVSKKIAANRLMKVKLEVDVDPPLGFETEARYLLEPIPFVINIYKPSSLFAGKLHAVLCRSWQIRTKGRDWYDLVWYVSKKNPVNISHLEKRMKQSGHFENKDKLTANKLKQLLYKKISSTDFEAAKKDISPMLKDPESIKVWSKTFFGSLVDKIITA